MALPTTERLVWQCGGHIAKLESTSCHRFLITKICCFLWHEGAPPTAVPPTHTHSNSNDHPPRQRRRDEEQEEAGGAGWREGRGFVPVCSARYQVHGGDVCARHAGNALREQKERGQKKTSARGARDWAAQGQRSRSRANAHACACLLAIARAGVVCVCVFPFGIVSGGPPPRTITKFVLGAVANAASICWQTVWDEELKSGRPALVQL